MIEKNVKICRHIYIYIENKQNLMFKNYEIEIYV